MYPYGRLPPPASTSGLLSSALGRGYGPAPECARLGPVTRDEAFQLLGLYLGASEDHIRAKHASRREAVELRLAAAPSSEHAALRAELARLDEAAAIASGRAPEGSAPTSSSGLPVTRLQTAVGGPAQSGTQPIPAAPGRRSRGWIVLVALLVGLAGYYVATKAGMWFFDSQHKEEAAPAAIAEAETASVAWLTYLSRSGRSETDEGRKAAEALHKGAGARAAGDMALAVRQYNEAWQGFFNAFRAEAALAEKAWQDDVARPWREKLKPSFPFTPGSDQDAPVAVLSRLVNPRDGTVWRDARWFDAMAVVELKGTRFFTPPAGRADFMLACEGLRDALFAADRDRLWVPFAARILHGRLWGKITFEVGDKVGTSERDGEFEAFSWRNESGGCVLKAFGPAARKESATVDRGASPWGLLRVLRECRYEGVVDNVHSWGLTPLEGALAGGKREAPTLQVMVDRKPSPFDPAIYAAPRLD